MMEGENEADNNFEALQVQIAELVVEMRTCLAKQIARAKQLIGVAPLLSELAGQTRRYMKELEDEMKMLDEE
eukprot:9883409-Karenia_brevis.AAC.1